MTKELVFENFYPRSPRILVPRPSTPIDVVSEALFGGALYKMNCINHLNNLDDLYNHFEDLYIYIYRRTYNPLRAIQRIVKIISTISMIHTIISMIYRMNPVYRRIIQKIV